MPISSNENVSYSDTTVKQSNQIIINKPVMLLKCISCLELLKTQITKKKAQDQNKTWKVRV